LPWTWLARSRMPRSPQCPPEAWKSGATAKPRPLSLVEHRGEAGLQRALAGAPQRPFGTLPIGDVHDHADELVRRSGLVEHGLISDVHVADRAVGPDDADIHRIVALVAHGIIDRAVGELPAACTRPAPGSCR
jgi:hypothetical protein